MQMSGMEILVAKMERLPVIYAVFNDSRYNMVYHGYKQVYGREISFETTVIDFKKWGESLGIKSEYISHPGEITKELLDSLTSDGPALLDIRIDRDIHMDGSGRNENLQRMSCPMNYALKADEER
jgi:thiamine pyrophosphate-dependent acetolactate synthase large subunit-like protein